MEIKIFNLKLKNFKGIKELEINFDCKDTNIYGQNATGKTTIFDAFKWLFFDKDSNDRKDFNIKTLDVNNKPVHFLEHEVEATLVIDGQDIVFKKIFQEKWVKRRGQENQEFAGHETTYWIDEVPTKKKDYEEKINNIIPESLFKLITDPSYFNNQMSWRERRELLISISGTNITDEDILNSDERYLTLKENLQNRSIDDYKKVLFSKIKEFNSEKEKIPVRIDELTNTLINEHNIDYEKLEQEKVNYNDELQKTEKQMTDIQIRAQENMKKVDELTMAKNELHNLKFRLEVEHSNKYSSEKIALDNEKSLLETKLRNNKQQISELEIQIKNDENRKQELYQKWDEISQSTIGDFNSEMFICPTCKREYPTEKVEEMKKEFIDNFNKHKEDEKKKINAEGQELNKRITENIEKLNNEYITNKGITEDLNSINSKITEYEKQKSEEKPFEITKIPEYKSKLEKVEKLQEMVDNLASEDITEIQNRKSNIIGKINDIDKQLNERDTQEKTKVRIKELEKQEEEITKKIQDLESQQYQIEEFTKAKVELLENAINSNFKIVRFRLFKTQINGGLEECCDVLVNGVPYADVNNAHKIIAGLDIINTISKFHNRVAPIFIDNRESINQLCETDSQIISLIVSEDPQLRIEVM